jgi:fatty-acyl-CoA synthase
VTEGLMQAVPLMISSILRYAAAAHGTREITSRLIDEPDWRYDYAGLARRCERLAEALRGLGVGRGKCFARDTPIISWRARRLP